MKILLEKILSEPLDLNYNDGNKLLINTVNAHTLNLIRTDDVFYEGLLKSDILLPDGVGTLFAGRLLAGKKLKKISGYDLFIHEMEKLNMTGGKCFFLGSSEGVLDLIRLRARNEYPNVKLECFSPPFKAQFNDQDNLLMINAVAQFCPDVLFVGMTQPKQEKWAAEHLGELKALHICCIGAVFDFYAGTVKRAPQWMIRIGLEWFYRLYKEPKRMWKRYVIGNIKFLYWIIKEKLTDSVN
jgi:N-acetylglucosaminyldiphosphoundecaprenol N-acetyl-beta-D-mannosaminyltransferase